MKILSIDPGKSTGWAVIEVENSVIKLGMFGVTKDMTLVDIQDHIKDADIVVFEGFWIRPDKAMAGKFNWQDMPAEKVIGSLMTLCKLHQKTQVIKQQPSVRVPGYAFANLVYKKGAKGKHWQDALAHGVYYAVTKLQAYPVHATKI